MHVAEPEGTQAGEQGSLRLVPSTGTWQSGHVAVCPNMHAFICQTKPLLGFTGIDFTCPASFMNDRYIPCCKGAFRFPKRRDAGTLPKVQVVVAGPHGTLSPKLPPSQGHGPISGCHVAAGLPEPSRVGKVLGVP